LGKYVVVLVVALWATHLLLSRRGESKSGTATGKSLQRALESTLRKVFIAVAVLVAALALILLIKHVTA
jgi:hypothetical protein